ncbi:MAG: hypothetical protein AAF192_06335 [Pseudomonadota bacterium]
MLDLDALARLEASLIDARAPSGRAGPDGARSAAFAVAPLAQAPRVDGASRCPHLAALEAAE